MTLPETHLFSSTFQVCMSETLIRVRPKQIFVVYQNVELRNCFCSFLKLEGAGIRPQIRHSKFSGMCIIIRNNNTFGLMMEI